MEDNLQTIVVVVISVILLFIFPVYMAYEKKDDISYALAMRYTQDFVDEVRNKGYITRYMYEDYRAKLKVTGNSYDIQMNHEYKRYDPITKYYSIDQDTMKHSLVKTTTQEEKEKWYKEIEQIGRDNTSLTDISSKEEVQAYIADYLKDTYAIVKVEDTYEMSTQVYNKEHIVNVLYNEQKLKLNNDGQTVNCVDGDENICQYAYTMNVDDTFNVTIKNTNVTLATVIYNMVTANVMDENTRIYVNYGGTILSSKWYGDIDYAMLEETVKLGNLSLKYSLNPEKKFTTLSRPITAINKTYDGEYRIEFDVKPGAVTELKEKGIRKSLEENYYDKFNFVLGNKTAKNTHSMMSVAVGYNGILLMTHAIKKPTYHNETNIISGTIQRKITDYSKATIRYNEASNEIKVNLTGKTGIADCDITLPVTGAKEAFLGAQEVVISNPQAQSYTKELSWFSNITIVFGTNSIVSTTVSSKTLNLQTVSELALDREKEITSYTKVEISYNETNRNIQITLIDEEGNRETKYMDCTGNSQLFKDASAIVIESPEIGTKNVNLSNGIAQMKVNFGSKAITNITVENKVIRANSGGADLPVVDKKITDYNKATIWYNQSRNMIEIELQGKPGVGNVSKEISVEAGNRRFFVGGLNTTIDNPQIASVHNPKDGMSITFGEKTIKADVQIEEPYEEVILSYPADIKEYTHIAIEVKAKKNNNDDDNNKYIATLFVDNEKMDESVEMDYLPKIDNIGSTYIGTLQKYFIGSIKNIKLYY